MTAGERLVNQGRMEGLLKGRAEGLKMGIKGMLKIKFKEAGLQLMPNVEKINDIEKLQKVEEFIEKAENVEELSGMLKVL